METVRDIKRRSVSRYSTSGDSVLRVLVALLSRLGLAQLTAKIL